MLPPPRATILLVFVHGFKGHDEKTFLDFPNRIRTILTNAHLNLDIDALAYPQYDTRGDITQAVQNLVEWTQMTVKERQGFNTSSHHNNDGSDSIPPPPVYVCYLGHSMGGLVCADAALELDRIEQMDASKKSPSPIVGLLAFDTPYFGLNHNIFTEAGFNRVSGYAEKATAAYSLVSAYMPSAAAAGAAGAATAGMASVATESTARSAPSSGGGGWGGMFKSMANSALTPPTSSNSNNNNNNAALASTEAPKPASKNSGGGGWGKWGNVALGVGALVAATGVAVVASRQGKTGMDWITSHVQFVGVLWNGQELRMRVQQVLKLPIGFHCFYTQINRSSATTTPIMGADGKQQLLRGGTFIELDQIPEYDLQRTRSYFSARQCSGTDEIEAHMEMFNPAKNIDYFSMGEDTVKRIRGMVEEALAHRQMM